MGGGEDGLVVVRGRVEIDMRQPFRSVKEAVVLFGEKVLAGQVYANNLKQQMQMRPNVAATAAELEETKHSLEKAKEESSIMALCLNSLRQELEETKTELRQLKKSSSRKDYYHSNNNNNTTNTDKLKLEPEIEEEIKFVENTNKIEEKNKVIFKQKQHDDDEYDLEFEKKRTVKFASPPALTRVIVTNNNTKNNTDREKEEEKGEGGIKRTPTHKSKLKRRPLIPLIGGLLLKKKGNK